MPFILAIESSCDDTGAAVISNGVILSNVVSSQPIHEKYGGVVPELASRAHQGNIVPVVDAALRRAGITVNKLDAIGVTQGPGLMGSLLVGMSFAKSLSLALNKPLVCIDHLYAHLAAHFIDDPKPAFPFLCLLVSGGHTLLVKMHSPTEYSVIGRTTDDAAGEAFDKAAKVLGLPYPGGPLIDKYAKDGDPARFSFPKPDVPGYDYSFSGLKTAFLYFIRDGLKHNPKFIEENLSDICASYQHRIVDYLIENLDRAASDLGITEIGISGGVAANSYLRKRVTDLASQKGWKTYIPAFEYCTDNAAMIAKAAELKLAEGKTIGLEANVYSKTGF